MIYPDVEINEQVVRDLLHEQHRDLADLELRFLASGWDNDMWRLGSELVVRLPLHREADVLIGHEIDWVAVASSSVTTLVPQLVRVGEPSRPFSYRWLVMSWIDGTTLAASDEVESAAVARDLGRFLRELHRDAPANAPTNRYRGILFAERVELFERHLSLLRNVVDESIASEIFDEALRADPWDRPPQWLHGDPHPLNLIVKHGRLAGVVDWGDICCGDPASDLAIAWMCCDSATRPVLFEELDQVHASTWTRARGWALALALAIAFGENRRSPGADPTMLEVALHTLQHIDPALVLGTNLLVTQ